MDISFEVLVNDGTTFTAKFNDGNVLTLAIGSKGTVTTPQLRVHFDRDCVRGNFWHPELQVQKAGKAEYC